MPIPIAKNQHTVPESYLSAWESTKKTVWVFDASNESIYNPNKRNVTGEHFFYDTSKTLDATNKDRFQGHEKMLQELENIVAPILKKLNEETRKFTGILDLRFSPPIIDEDSMIFLSLFMCTQMLRTKSVRDGMQKGFENMMQKNAFDSIPILYPNYDLKNNWVTVSAPYIKSFHINFLWTRVPKFARILVDKYWVFEINKTSEPLITSDNPVVRSFTIPGQNGITAPGGVIVYPLGPHVALTLYDKRVFGHLASRHRRHTILERAEVRRRNQLQVIDCHRQLISSDNNLSWVKDFLPMRKKYMQEKRIVKQQRAFEKEDGFRDFVQEYRELILAERPTPESWIEFLSHKCAEFDEWCPFEDYQKTLAPTA